MAEPPVLLVIADSLAHHGPERAHPADHPRIWPVLAAAELGWRCELVARVGWTSRDAWWALTQDPRVWAATGQAGAVVLAVGGMDTLPSPLPTALREQLRYLRPPALRRVARAAYGWAQPRLSPLGRPVALPPRLSVEHLELCRAALHALRPDLPVIGTLPSVHRSAAYAGVHAGRPAAERALRVWSATSGVPLVDLRAAVGEHVLSGRGNPDGLHWGWEGHRSVADAVVAQVRATTAAQVRASGVGGLS
ncbi:SGNH/GDSL hydrolase family protein [Rhodococcus antarcticus]|uniref:SGNH/GDSL hydrolase family protein n=1 Tax=Rhodococcus antarcticus TaxID=2987751 RepID=A0ABY6NWM4_9NOCA|nr:diglucosylglycerate octanoyltransferase [Rhodococcus antarcticus]UZJ23792.1 SGNH/GDSL hydrolase family protein [Rhodococcus antarcticus]